MHEPDHSPCHVNPRTRTKSAHALCLRDHAALINPPHHQFSPKTVVKGSPLGSLVNTPPSSPSSPSSLAVAALAACPRCRPGADLLSWQCLLARRRSWAAARRRNLFARFRSALPRAHSSTQRRASPSSSSSRRLKAAHVCKRSGVKAPSVPGERCPLLYPLLYLSFAEHDTHQSIL